MPGFTLKIQVGQETHRRWVDTAENEPLTFDAVVAECNAMRDAGYVADGHIMKYRDVNGDEIRLEPGSWRDFMATVVGERGRAKLTLKLDEARPPAAQAAPHQGQQQRAGAAPAAAQQQQHLPAGQAPQPAGPPPAGYNAAPPPPPYPVWGPQVVPNPREPMMMPPPVPPMPPAMVMAEEAIYQAPPQILYRYCFRMAQHFCRMCGAYVTEDHLQSRCHLRRLQDWRYWMWQAERREAAAAAAVGQPDWYYQAPPPLGPLQ